MRPTFDEKDEQIRLRNLREFDLRPGPRVGDYVDFSDGVTRRISYVWDDGVQTSDGGSWYFGLGYCSFSGGLYPSIKLGTLSLTKEKREGDVWFFHHDFSQAHNGVYTKVPFRVFKCSEPAGECYLKGIG